LRRAANTYYNRGLAWAAQGKFDKAIRDFNKTIALDPKAADAYNNRANAWASTGELDNAIKDYAEAVELTTKESNKQIGRQRLALDEARKPHREEAKK
jgi:tetratricopeptide (TPR) repeat protein